MPSVIAVRAGEAAKAPGCAVAVEPGAAKTISKLNSPIVAMTLGGPRPAAPLAGALLCGLGTDMHTWRKTELGAVIRQAGAFVRDLPRSSRGAYL
jgi:hypothetical protein